MVTVPESTSTAWLKLALISGVLPVPSIVTLLVIEGSGLLNRIAVLAARPAKLMVLVPPAALASTIACRNVPVPAPGAGSTPPLSPLLLTTNVRPHAELTASAQQTASVQRKSVVRSP